MGNFWIVQKWKKPQLKRKDNAAGSRSNNSYNNYRQNRKTVTMATVAFGNMADIIFNGKRRNVASTAFYFNHTIFSLRPVSFGTQHVHLWHYIEYTSFIIRFLIRSLSVQCVFCCYMKRAKWKQKVSVLFVARSSPKRWRITTKFHLSFQSVDVVLNVSFQQAVYYNKIRAGCYATRLLQAAA